MRKIKSIIAIFIFMVTANYAQHDSVFIEVLVKKSFDKRDGKSFLMRISDSLENGSKSTYKNFLLKINSKAIRAGNVDLQALSQSYLGLLYLNLSLYSDSYTNLSLALKLYESQSNQKGISISFANLGNLYYYMGDPKKALVYNFKSLQAIKNKEQENCTAIVNLYLNIGSIYGSMGNILLARSYFFNALEKYKFDPDRDSITKAYILNNICSTYQETKDKVKAEEYGKKAFNLKLKYGDKNDVADAYVNYSTIYYEQKKYKEARDFLLKALENYDLKTPSNELSICYQNLSDANGNLKNYKDESKYLILAFKTKKYIDSIGRISEVSNNEIRTEFKQKSLNDSLQNQIQINMRDLELVQKKRESYFGIILLIIVSASAFLFYRRFKLSQKQKAEIEFQKKVVEVKNKEITESINYAKNVQDALMPHLNELSEIFKDSFVTYLPKDIVAGDFYWWHNFVNTGKNKTLIAVADCTGHGVPGAMVSIVCINALNRAVNEFELENPNEVLDKVNELVNETFSKNNKHINDGMDVSLLCVDYDNNIVTWSGANNRLIYFESDKLIEVKADKQAIGKSEIKKPFHMHTLPLVKNTVFYLLTDGFSDQFGGSKNKKMGFAKFKNLMLENFNKPLIEQGEHYQSTFIDWKNNLEQTDDVTLVGIKV